MQPQLFQNLDAFEHFSALKEYVPLIDQVINGNLIPESSPISQHQVSSFFQKCLEELKECKATISMQEDTLQSATEAIISLREENTQLADSNQSLTNQIGDLKNFLNESDAITTSLRSEVNQLKQENRALVDAADHMDLSSRDESSRICSEPFDQVLLREKEFDLVSEKYEQDSAAEVLQQKESMIKVLMQNVEELSGYREKYNQLIQENEAYKTLAEQTKRLQEELVTAQEENKKLKNKGPECLLRRLKSLECLENSDKIQETQFENENLWSIIHHQEEDYQNKNFLARKSLTMASPSKENVDLKKQSLLMETILFNSTKSPNTPLRNKSNDLKKITSAHHTPRNMANLNFGGLLPNSTKAMSNPLIEASMKETQSECGEYKLKNTPAFSSSLYNFKELPSNRKEILNNSARKHDDRVYLRENSIEIHNTSRNSEELYFDELLSWEEGDFPRLNTSNITCSSPNIEAAPGEDWIARHEFGLKELIAKDQSLKINLQSGGINDVFKQKEDPNNIIRENKHMPCQEQNEKGQEIISRLPPKIPNKAIDKTKNALKKGHLGPMSVREHNKFKENTTQTEEIKSLSIDHKDGVELKASRSCVPVTWKSFISLPILLLYLVTIYFISRGADSVNREL